MDVDEQEVLLLSYRSARDIRRDRWRYHQPQTELEATYKEFDEVFGKSKDGYEVASLTSPRCHDHEADMSMSVADSEDE